MTNPENSTPGTPNLFTLAYPELLAAGWAPLPLPPGSKSPPPPGTTGFEGRDLTADELEFWAAKPLPLNVAIRPREGVLGLDVDAYGQKRGATTLDALVEHLGPLPMTVMTTRRWPADAVSGIRWFRLPDGAASQAWPPAAGPGIELIRHVHRYGVAPTSRVAVEGLGLRTYMAVDQATGEVTMAMPTVESLPLLPLSWVAHFDGLAGDPWMIADGEPAEYLTDGQPCLRLAKALESALDRLASGEARHDAMLHGSAVLAALGARGHSGSAIALESLRGHFMLAVAGDRTRHPAEEWRRATEKLAAKLAGTPAEGCGGETCGEVLELELDDEDEEAPQERRRRLELERRVYELELGAEAKEIVRRRSLREWAPAKVVNLRDFLAAPPPAVEERVMGLLPVKGTALLTAARKTGKTTLLVNLLKSLVDGNKLFGEHEVEPVKRVMLIDVEMTEPLLYRYMKGLGIRNIDRIALVAARGRVAETFTPLRGDPAKLTNWLAAQRPDVLVIDPLAPLLAALGWSENDNTDVRQALTLLIDVATQAGISELVLAHHTGWDDPKSAVPVRARGASSFEDTPDVLWRLEREAGGGRVFHAMGRLGDTERQYLELADDGRLTYGQTPAELKSMLRIAETEEMVRDYLQDQETPVSRRTLCRDLGRNKPEQVRTIEQVLSHFESKGLARRTPGRRAESWLWEWVFPLEDLE